MVWPQVAGGPSHAIGHVAAPFTLERQWRTAAYSRKARGAPVTSAPAVSETSLFVIDAIGSVVAIDIATGDETWRTTLTPDVRDENVRAWNIFAKIDPKDLGFGGGVALANGRVFVTSGFGFVAALDAGTGELLWQIDTPSPTRNPPTVANGLVIAVTISNQVIAYDQQTGDEVWSYESFEESARFLASAAPAVEGESVVVPFSSGEIVSLSRTNGRVLWQAVIARTSRLNALSTFGDIAGSPVIDRGAVFTVSQAGQMAGIDLRTGNVAWEQPVGGQNLPWVAGETIYVLSNRGSLTALNRVDGRVRWTAELPLWRNPDKRKKRRTWSGPVLAGGKLYLSGSERELVAVDPQNGEIIDEYRLKEGSTQPPVVAQGMLFVITDDGFIEAFGAAPFELQ
nr:PQQ-binding-like beta-propeller repeat protein [Parvularcula mediterranea]